MGNIAVCGGVEEEINSGRDLKVSYYQKRRHNNQKKINYDNSFDDSINQKEKNSNSYLLNQIPKDKKPKKIILRNITDKNEEDIDKEISSNIKNNSFSILKNKIKKLNSNNQTEIKKCDEEDCDIIECDNDELDNTEKMTNRDDNKVKKIENINVKINYFNNNYKNAKLNEQKNDYVSSIDSIFDKDINMELSTTKNKISEIHSTIFDNDNDNKSEKNFEEFVNINDDLSNYHFINNNQIKAVNTISVINNKNIIDQISISIDEKQNNKKNNEKKIFKNKSYINQLKKNNIYCLNCLTERYTESERGLDIIANLRRDWIKKFGNLEELLLLNQISKKKKNRSCEIKKSYSISEKMKAIKQKSKKENYMREFQKQKEEQDKKIAVLQEKLNNLYQILNNNDQNSNKKNIKKIHDCNSDIYVKKIHSYKSENNFYHKQLENFKQKEIEKDNKIKELENKLKFVMETNCKNRFILTQKEKQIQQLLSKNSEQNTIIKKYKKVSENFSNNKNNNFNNTCRAYSKSKNFSDYDFNSSIDTSKMNINPANFCFHKKNLSINTKTGNKLFDNLRISKANSCRNFERQNPKILNAKQQIFSKKKIVLKYELPNFNSNKKKNINNNRIKNKFKISKVLCKNNNNNSNNNTKNNNTRNSSITDKNITYSNYCNSLNHKLKNQYIKKINLNKLKIYKINKAENQKQVLSKLRNSKKIFYPTKEKTEIKTVSKSNIINKNSIRSRQIKKSKIKNQTIKKETLKEMYLKAGTVQFETEDNIVDKSQNFSSIINLNNTTNSNFNITKNILSTKFSDLLLSQGSNNINSNNKNILDSMIISPKTSKSNNIDFFENFEKKFNDTGNINNNSIKSLTSESSRNFNENKKIYTNIYNDGCVRYKEINNNVSFHDEKENNNDNVNNSNEFKINFGLVSGNMNLLVNGNDIMSEIIDKFLNEFFLRKEYNESERDYIKNNICFLFKDHIIDKNKSLLDNKIENNAVIIPVLKDIT